ncbi:hypothetical protein HDA40_005214 [Hamadaea flava]|uniref:DUF4350 domain-containing protein n=1 Tax=Hamadaea flava TaxID=1742688 RepID=A0ABV8M1H9_9ACTN|nr:DUF4350 domain-containing protein [Hamadaea flava]MCP2326707.1 hypothetical protein [Hamadaea flava]
MTVLEKPVLVAAKPVAKPKRRWHRIAIPFGVVLALIVATLVLHALNEPEVDDPDFLSPVSSAALGSATLADRLIERGVHVERQTRTSDALLSAYQGDATLLIPAPALMHRDYLRMLRSMPPSTRVVLVEPDNGVLTRSDAPIEQVDRRWATAVVPPGGCVVTGLTQAGPAAVRHSAYAAFDDGRYCYEQGVVAVRWQLTELIAVGSADPFRNDRLDENDNLGFALGLLGQQAKLVWLDVHQTEPGPKVDPNASPGSDGVPPSLAPGGGGTGDGTGEGSGDGQGSGSGSGTGQTEQGSGEASGQPEEDSASPPDPPTLFDALPPWFWATLAGLALLVVLLAVAAARRLGPPVAEPLPFRVRGAETVLGRARLYQRAGAMLSGAQTMRRTVGPQIAVAVGLPPTAEAEAVATAIAARHGGDPADYLAVLADDLPKKDAELVALAARLDALLALVTAPPQGENRG